MTGECLSSQVVQGSYHAMSINRSEHAIKIDEMEQRTQ